MPELMQNDPQIDLANCEREPIHIPGRIQSHGLLIVLDSADLTIRHISENALALIGAAAGQLIGCALDGWLDPESAHTVRNQFDRGIPEANPLYVGAVTTSIRHEIFDAIAHRYKGNLFLELESLASSNQISVNNLYSELRVATGRLKGASSVKNLCQIIAEEIRRITGFDRVMVYRFDSEWNGTVVAEDKAEDWHSYLDLRFPASDIPRQARQLYLLNRLRLIADVESQPAGLLPAIDPTSGTPIDLSYAALRSVSPVHIEYLKNMAVGASMSVSLTKEDQLWGLVACHHRTARHLGYEVRAGCEHLGEIAAVQISAAEYAQSAERRLHLKVVHAKLITKMAAEENFVNGLITSADDLLALTGASGAAIYTDGTLQLLGQTPSAPGVEHFIAWFSSSHEDDEIYHTETVPDAYDAPPEFREKVSGILVLSITRSRKNFIIWFRPEVVRTVQWAGNPHKAVEQRGGDAPRLHPRRSFESWQEIVRGRSQPWLAEEIESARELRTVIVGIILRRAEELASLNAELKRSNKELEAFSYSVSHDLRAPIRHMVGFSDLLQKRASTGLDETSQRYIKTIRDAALNAGRLVDGLLAFSQMGRTPLKPMSIEMNELVKGVLIDLQVEWKDRQIEWNIGPLPEVRGDLIMLRLAVQNLISNAIKFTRGRPVAQIEIGTQDNGGDHLFWVKDNGVGFDMRFKDKLFGVFQRFHRVEEFEGTGIGLANVRRTIERHGGMVWADATPGQGAAFFFTLPRIPPETA